MVIDLTIKEIMDLAEFAGISIDKNKLPDDDLDTVICIADCPSVGMPDEDGKLETFNYVMYFEEYPEEGCIPLGDAIQ